MIVGQGPDAADIWIADRVGPGDICVTGDIPLAAEVIDSGAHALNPRGELYSPDNIKARLTMRDFMDTMRASGIATGGPPALSQSDRMNFSNNLDRLLTQYA